uniref:Secreted protein n=1 Tax=Rhizophora mucronata TaxID=61149 RepID=A0A2P2IM48_RHIMU
MCFVHAFSPMALCMWGCVKVWYVINSCVSTSNISFSVERFTDGHYSSSHMILQPRQCSNFSKS